MSKALKELITDLSKNPDLEEKFNANPDEVMDQYGLSEQEKELIRNEDLAGVQKALGQKVNLKSTTKIIKLS
jgi:hypothetical protein